MLRSGKFGSHLAGPGFVESEMQAERVFEATNETVSRVWLRMCGWIHCTPIILLDKSLPAVDLRVSTPRPGVKLKEINLMLYTIRPLTLADRAFVIQLLTERWVKPSVPAIGRDGIPLRDLIELEMVVAQG